MPNTEASSAHIPVEVWTQIFKRLPDLKCLDALTRASRQHLGIFRSSPVEILECVMVFLHPDVRLLMRSYIIAQIRPDIRFKRSVAVEQAGRDLHSRAKTPLPRRIPAEVVFRTVRTFTRLHNLALVIITTKLAYLGTLHFERLDETRLHQYSAFRRHSAGQSYVTSISPNSLQPTGAHSIARPPSITENSQPWLSSRDRSDRNCHSRIARSAFVGETYEIGHPSRPSWIEEQRVLKALWSVEVYVMLALAGNNIINAQRTFDILRFLNINPGRPSRSDEELTDIMFDLVEIWPGLTPPANSIWSRTPGGPAGPTIYAINIALHSPLSNFMPGSTYWLSPALLSDTPTRHIISNPTIFLSDSLQRPAPASIFYKHLCAVYHPCLRTEIPWKLMRPLGLAIWDMNRMVEWLQLIPRVGDSSWQPVPHGGGRRNAGWDDLSPLMQSVVQYPCFFTWKKLCLQVQGGPGNWDFSFVDRTATVEEHLMREIRMVYGFANWRALATAGL